MASRCAFAVVLDEQSRVLLCLRKRDGKWNLPGGAVDPGEAPWDAASREVREELEIEVKVDRLCGLYHVAEKDELVLTFIAKITDGTPTLREDVAEIRWFECSGLPPHMRERHAERLQDALRGEGVVFRTQS